jgi:outer membrane receptor for ferrienterochelin and colicin
VVQTGLRAEAHRIGSSQEGREIKDRYTHWTPSLFVLYQAEAAAKWRLAYSRQQQAASLEARNPRLVYQDAQTLNQGNPNLKAQTTDSFELSYERFGEKGATQVRLFYAPTRDVVVPVTRLLADGVIVRGQENGGSGYGLGFDVNTGRQLTNKLNLQLQLGVTRNSRDAQNGEHEQATALSGQAILNYGLSDKDNIALTYMVQGSGLTGQGTSKPFSTSSINYSHTFSPKLTLTIDVQNPFGKGRTRQRYETPTLITTIESRSENRIVTFTLRRSFVRFER